MTASRMLTDLRSYALGGLAALALAALFAPAAAQAGPLVASAPDCEQQSTTHPFLPWIDPAQYAFAPDGGFEDGAAGWSLDGATVVEGNESHYLNDAGDTQALRVPAGSSATSPTVCVGIEHPTIRLVTRKASGLVAAMTAEVLFEDAAGNVRSLPIGAVLPTGSWQPTAPMPIVANLMPLLPGDHTPVQLRFRSLAGDWLIDDLYVDPYRRG